MTTLSINSALFEGQAKNVSTMIIQVVNSLIGIFEFFYTAPQKTFLLRKIMIQYC